MEELFVRPSCKTQGSFGVYMRIGENRASEMFTSLLPGNEGRDECQKRKKYMEKLMSSDKLYVYVLSIVSTEGYSDGSESDIKFFDDFMDMALYAYQDYRKVWNEDFKDEEEDDVGRPFLNDDQFFSELANTGYVVVQYPDFHIQYEFHKKEL